MDEEAEKLKTKEQWLREEIRVTRGTIINIMQWGTTLLVAAESSLYFVRKDVVAHLVLIGNLKPGVILSWPRWTTGTLFLLLIASIFCAMHRRGRDRQRLFRRQLAEMNPSYSGIKELEAFNNFRGRSFYLIYFLFPMFDQLLWMGFSAARSFNIPW